MVEDEKGPSFHVGQHLRLVPTAAEDNPFDVIGHDKTYLIALDGPDHGVVQLGDRALEVDLVPLTVDLPTARLGPSFSITEIGASTIRLEADDEVL